MPRYYRERIYSLEEKGFLKGHFEKLFRDRDLELIRKGEVQRLRDREQAVLAAYRVMESQDLKFKI